MCAEYSTQIQEFINLVVHSTNHSGLQVTVVTKTTEAIGVDMRICCLHGLLGWYQWLGYRLFKQSSCKRALLHDVSTRLEMILAIWPS